MINKNIPRKSQNLIEIVIIIPLLLVILLGIIEYAVFQRNVSAVQDIALEAAVAASKQYVDESTTAGDPFSENPAVSAALEIVFKRLRATGAPPSGYSFADSGLAFGQRPFALYEFYSDKQIAYRGKTVPVVIFTIDYRDPVREGVSTQLIFHYSLIFFGFRLCYWSGRCFDIIPETTQISSTQTRQYVYY